MGFGGISVWSLLLILVIVLLLFGTKKLRNVGTDLGGAIRGFKQAMGEGEKGGDKKDEDSSERLESGEGEDGGQQADASRTEDETARDRHHSG